MENENINYEKLLQEFNNNRPGLYDILEKISFLRNKLEIMSTDSTDFRIKNKAFEKMKAASEIIKAELDIRKAIDASISKEIEMRRKLEEQLNKYDDSTTLDSNYKDIKFIADYLAKNK